tara:strand:+ start:100 stop:333 length:234 start_codon:yes stop_codon:yes gene_type:complete
MARGKTKGAGSFLQVNLRELNRVLKEDAVVIISRRYAETLNLKVDKFEATTKNIKAKEPVDFKSEELAPVQVEEENW